MADMKLPGLGNVPKPVVVVSVIGGGALAVYIYEKHKAATAQQSAVANTAYGYGGYGAGYGYSNPAFVGGGYPYEYGYGQYGYGYYGYGGEFAGLGGYGSPTPVYAATGTTTAATTNAGWAEAAESYLSGTGGADAATVAAALGKYITGGSVTADQAAIIQEAIAFEGYPPQPGANNYPPNINQTGTTGQGGGGTGTTAAGTKTVQAPGNQDLSQFAHAHGTQGGKLIALKGNKWLAAYYGNTKKIPKGYKVTVPA